VTLYGPLTDAFIATSFERLRSAEGVAAWAMWDRVFNAYRRLFGEALDMQTDRGEWI